MNGAEVFWNIHATQGDSIDITGRDTKTDNGSHWLPRWRVVFLF
jgi:hypothetical protein